MRHRVAGNRLGRTASHRRAMLRNMAASLFVHKKIRTTEVKAKALRGVAERLITFAKRGDVAARRQVAKTIPDRTLLKHLFSEIAPTFADRPGGYTRVIKIGRRKGDGAAMAFIELVGFEHYFASKREEQASKREAREKGRRQEGGAGAPPAAE